MQKYQDVVQDRTGRVLSGASVHVTTEAGATATLYSDNGTTTKANPTTTNSDGEFSFYAANGKYTLTTTVRGGTDVQEVLLFDPADAGVVSVKQYGAKGDGSTDDSTAINAAIAALNAGTIRRIHFPAGTYRHDSTLATITRDAVAITGEGPRLSILSPRSTASCLTFSSSTPNSDRLSDVFVSQIGINQGSVTAPSAGRMLTLTRVDRAYFDNVDIRNCYQGVLIEGGGDIHITSTTITGSSSWSSVQAGSYLLKFAQHAGSLEIPREVFINNFNIKGVGTFNTADHYLSACIVIEAADGIYFDTGHYGFSYESPLYINPQNVASASVQNIEFSNVYGDGNGAGNTATSGVLLSGSTTPVVEHIKFSACSFKNFDGNGMNLDLGTLFDLKIHGCEITDNGGFGLIVNGCNKFSLIGTTIAGNNGGGASGSAVSLVDVDGGVISSNMILEGSTPHTNGLNINSACSDLVVSSNLMEGHTNDFVCSSTSRISFSNNRKLGSDPTVVASDGFSPPMGYDVVEVTGNTNFSNIGGTLIPNYRVTLRFAGTPTASDGAGNLKLAGNFVATADSTLTVMVSGSNWTEVSRAVV